MMQKMKCMALLLAVCLLTGCAASANNALPQETKQPENNIPRLPEKLDVSEHGIPVLKVYVTDDETVQQMDIEQYLLGVVAG